MSFLITGYGRSGTKYTTKVFKALGYKVKHERNGVDGTISWKHLPQWKKYDIVLQQVRYPLDVFQSAETGKISSFKFIIDNFGGHIPESKPITENKLFWSMWAYYKWNKWAEKVAKYRYQIEKFDLLYPKIFHNLGLPIPNSLPNISRQVNSRKRHGKYQEITWKTLYDIDELLADKIKVLAKEYGYG